MKDLCPDKPNSLLGDVLRLSLPASVTMLSTTVTRFVDGIMVARVAPEAMTAQQIAGMIAFIPEAFAIGALSVVNTYVSQNLGAGRHRRCAAYAWAGVAVAFAIALLVSPSVLVARGLFAAMPTADPPFVEMQTLYFRYMVLGIFLTLPARPIDQFFYGTHRPRIVMMAALIANVFNVLGNYVLIYGKWGFPQMGLEGAAIGSVASWGLQLAILSWAFLARGNDRLYHTRRPRVRWKYIADIFRIGWASGLQFCNQVMSWSLFTTVLVGRFGAAHLAATTLSVRYMALSFMPTVGVGIATTALVGRLIGEGRKDLARMAVHKALTVAMVYMGLCGVAFWLFRGPMVTFFLGAQPGAAGLEAEILRVARIVLLMAAVFQLFDAVGIVYIGALRGAGDTRWPMVASISLTWCLTVGGGTLLVWAAPQLGSVGPWLAASVFVCVLGVLMGWRFESGAWEKIDLLGRGTPATTPVPEDTPAMPEALVAPRPKPTDNQG